MQISIEEMAELESWKDKENKKSIVLRGPRQVGKTTAVRCLGEKYDSFVEINFYERPELKRIFAGNLDVDTMLLNISALLHGIRLIPGKTLILLDEIQECPEAMTSLKFWTADNRFDVIATGSSLGIEFKTGTSYPVVDRRRYFFPVYKAIMHEFNHFGIHIICPKELLEVQRIHDLCFYASDRIRCSRLEFNSKR